MAHGNKQPSGLGALLIRKEGENAKKINRKKRTEIRCDGESVEGEIGHCSWLIKEKRARWEQAEEKCRKRRRKRDVYVTIRTQWMLDF